ncbi:ATP-dependent Zn protease [Mesorhizobium sp. VK25A]|uniref:ATP-dependent Zn protease n=1 Tax=Mesorhizobium vachelliae TaxID=3072309 RepID=A0ABU4ZXG3_9HYPH|nr:MULTISPECIES: ATP-dependent Zn protease [unclassified Mesorhizobium]MDX8530088.1 ATP-dependent Zn protease [Mesorhizobium sp. VK25D]MDX8544486.1 ATP-dependent Zn protease [Mesorhizobium sp. VK25A]
MSMRMDEQETLRRLARLAAGCSGADIERLVREARQVARRARRPLAYADLETRLAGSRPVRPFALRRRIAVHEAGHLLARLLHGVGIVTLVTIEGRDGDGFVEAIRDDEAIDTRERCLAMLAVLLGGRAAEQVAYGETLAGSGGSERSDLARATALAYAMEASLGFGSSEPLLYRDVADYHAGIRADPALAGRVSARLEKAQADIRKLIGRHRNQLDMIAEALVRHGTLEGKELAALIASLALPGREASGEAPRDREGS